MLRAYSPSLLFTMGHWLARGDDVVVATCLHPLLGKEERPKRLSHAPLGTGGIRRLLLPPCLVEAIHSAAANLCSHLQSQTLPPAILVTQIVPAERLPQCLVTS